MRGIGIDLVAMCVNDVITCGAEPLYFLDYICTSDIKLHGELVKYLVDGIAEGCKQSGCSLLGGGAAAALSRGDGRWWAIPLGVVSGAMIGCDIDGG